MNKENSRVTDVSKNTQSDHLTNRTQKELLPATKRSDIASLFFEKVDGKEKWYGAHTAAQLLLLHTYLRDMISSTDTGLTSIYYPEKGHYVYLSQAKLRVVVYQTFCQLGLTSYLHNFFITKVTENLVIFTGVLYDKESSRSLVALSNGVLDLRTFKLQDFNPRLWVHSKLPFPYDPAGRGTLMGEVHLSPVLRA
jgi:D5 N terminal like